jgi:hypothetical protein
MSMMIVQKSITFDTFDKDDYTLFDKICVELLDYVNKAPIAH